MASPCSHGECVSLAKSPPCIVLPKAACNEARQTCSCVQSHAGPEHTNIRCSSTLFACLFSFSVNLARTQYTFSLSSPKEPHTICPPRNHIDPLHKSPQYQPSRASFRSHCVLVSPRSERGVSFLTRNQTPTYNLSGRHRCHRLLLQGPARDSARDSLHLHHRRCRNLHPPRSHLASALLWRLLPMAS